ncbi:MAG: NnrS family protein [Spongiibacteraceae bacterium]|jgi:uncharacterized protein involved in response to NO|nr:NnrS family protein [Spongiibacteraceae bacterium]
MSRMGLTLFAYPFRIFFLSLAIWAMLLVPLWLAQLLTPFRLPLALDPLLWHQHEMLFGLLSAAIAGFLLTAVCTWTQTAPLRGGLLAGLWLVWVAGRAVHLLGAGLPYWAVIAPDLLFPLLVMTDAGWRIWRARQRRHLPVLGVLLLLWLCLASFYRAPFGNFVSGALVLAMALMLVIGGRITPAFSANWLRMQGAGEPAPSNPLWLEQLALVAVLLILPALLLGYPTLTAAVALVAAVLALLRIGLWRGWRVAAEPLLWILHLSLLWVPVALLLLAGSRLGWVTPFAWQHAAGIGAMGSLILGVMARVALGHTGRPLRLARGMIVAFALIQLAALARVLAAVGWLPWRQGLELSGAGWVIAFALFLVCYTRILIAPRPDGRPG